MKKTITIQGQESKQTQSGNNKIIFNCPDGKYHIYQNKNAGGYTKAYEQYVERKIKLGDTVDVEVSEEEKSFPNEKGENITYTDRFILFFYDSQTSQDTPQATQTPQAVPTYQNDNSSQQNAKISQEELEEMLLNSPTIKELISRTNKEESDVKIEDVPF